MEVAGSDLQPDVAQELLLLFGRRRPKHGVDGQGPPGRQVGVAHRPVVVVVGLVLLGGRGVIAVLVRGVLEVRLVLLFRVQGFSFEVDGLVLRVQGFCFRVSGFVFRVQGSGLGIII